uniref:Uncharacterized protein n=1 Tax=Branchiostoma floridae TaxID=7739 RepID=C3Y3K3_BRAFL|eukprot:XP_002608869.1 hypothetical protein BRAFLDRAFT_102045 [Branchiostoma floridae]
MYILYLANVAGGYIFSVMMSRWRKMFLTVVQYGRVRGDSFQWEVQSQHVSTPTPVYSVAQQAANSPRKWSKKTCCVTELRRVPLPRETTSPADISKISFQ